MSNEIECVQFHEDTIEAIRNSDGKAYVVIRRICENLGVDFAGQLRNLKTYHWACVDEMSMQIEGQGRSVAILPLDQLPMWMVKINVEKIAKELRPKLKLYQIEARDVLAAHFAPQHAVPESMDELDMLVVCATRLRDHDRRLRALENSNGHLAKIEQVEQKVDDVSELQEKHWGRFVAIPWLSRRGWKFDRKIEPIIGKQVSKISREQFEDEPSLHIREWNAVECSTYLPEALEAWIAQWGEKYPRS